MNNGVPFFLINWKNIFGAVTVALTAIVGLCVGIYTLTMKSSDTTED